MFLSKRKLRLATLMFLQAKQRGPFLEDNLFVQTRIISTNGASNMVQTNL